MDAWRYAVAGELQVSETNIGIIREYGKLFLGCFIALSLYRAKRSLVLKRFVHYRFFLSFPAMDVPHRNPVENASCRL